MVCEGQPRAARAARHDSGRAPAPPQDSGAAGGGGSRGEHSPGPRHQAPVTAFGGEPNNCLRRPALPLHL
jgi:hypothetical protein